MLGPGPLIAIDVVLLYTILGPLVLFAAYVFFDQLNQPDRPNPFVKRTPAKKNPAKWTADEVYHYLDQI